MTTSSMHTALAFFLATILAASCSPSGQLPIVPPPTVPTLASTASIRNDHGLDWVAISPDGKWVGASSTGDEVYLKEIATGREVVQHGLDSGDNDFDGFFAGGSGFAWLSDSSGILVTRGVRKREAYGPAVISLDGALTDHPTLALPEAPLSALLYIGNDGKAVATLGSHGQFQGRDPVMETPTLAFVDVRANRILQSVRYAEIFPADADSTPLMHMSSGVVLPDGRMKFVAVFSAHGPRKPRFIWLVWTQGEQPRIMHQSENPEGSIIGLSPDGRGVILVSRLMARSPAPMTRRATHPPYRRLARLLAIWTRRMATYFGGFTPRRMAVTALRSPRSAQTVAISYSVGPRSAAKGCPLSPQHRMDR